MDGSHRPWRVHAASFDRDGFGWVFIDGIQTGDPVDISAVGNIDTPDGLATFVGDDGTGNYGGPDSRRIEDAEMDDLGIWRRFLTADDVWAIYAAGTAGVDLAGAAVLVAVIPA